MLDKCLRAPYDKYMFMKRFYFIVSFLGFATLSTAQAFAQTSANSACPSNGFSALCLQATQLGPVIGSIITLFFIFIGLAALLFLVIGGFKWITSEGDKTNVEAARNQIVAAVVGLIVAFLSYLILNVLLNFLTGGKVNLTNLTIPFLGQ